MNLGDYPPEIARARVLCTKDAASFCGFDVQMWRKLLAEGNVPVPIKLSERKNGWRIGDLVDFINRCADKSA